MIPEVPVEPAALGAGLGWVAALESLGSIVVLMAASPMKYVRNQRGGGKVATDIERVI